MFNRGIRSWPLRFGAVMARIMFVSVVLGYVLHFYLHVDTSQYSVVAILCLICAPSAVSLAAILGLRISVTADKDDMSRLIVTGAIFGVPGIYKKRFGREQLRIIYLRDSRIYCYIGQWTMSVSSSLPAYDDIIRAADTHDYASNLSATDRLSVWSPAVELDLKTIRDVKSMMLYGMRAQTLQRVKSALRLVSAAYSEYSTSFQRRNTEGHS